MRVVVVNAGSSSVKLSLIGDGDVTLGDAEAVGHRIVHGGDRFREPVLIDDGVEQGLRELVEIAPLHQPKSLGALDAVSASQPGITAVACFDTAFHSTLSPAA